MLRAIAAIGLVIVAFAAIAGSFFSLRNYCSSDSPLVSIESHPKPNRSDDHTENTESTQQSAAPQRQQSKPSAAFNLRVTERNQIEGAYYAEDGHGKKGNWTHEFLCETKVGEFVIAVFTVLLVFFTGLLWKSTSDLAGHIPKVERAYISGGGVREQQIIGGKRYSTGRFQFHINNYGKTPGKLLRLGFGFCDATNIPMTPNYVFQPLLLPINPTLRGHPIWAETIPAEHNAPVVYGRFYFETIFGTRHSAGFIYRIAVGLDPVPVADAPSAYTDDRDGDA